MRPTSLSPRLLHLALRSRTTSTTSPHTLHYLQQSRTLTTTPQHQSAWSPGHAPPRLPKEEQEIYEQLQRQSTGAFSTPRSPPKINQSPLSSSSPSGTQVDTSSTSAKVQVSSAAQEGQDVSGKFKKGEELHPDVRRGARPEFEGDVNPKTGESGGPKNEPLRWKGDWSYNGRVTDF